MLGKLLKHEIKSTARIFFPLYGMLLIVALINKILNLLFSFSSETESSFASIPQNIMILIFIFMIAATMTVTLIMCIQRFYKNLLGDEGYLMFTLPAKAHEHIISKLLTSVIWFILSPIAILLSFFILMPFGAIPDLFYEFSLLVAEIIDLNGVGNFILYSTEILIFSFLGTLASVMMLYASMAVGHLMQKNRLLFSFVAFIGISTILQIIASIVISICSYTIFLSLTDELAVFAQLHTIFIIIGVITVAFATSLFFVTNHVLSKKLNLE